MKDYYRILQVEFNSSEEDIEIAYKLAIVNSASDDKEKKDVREAYKVLSDSQRRKIYNERLFGFSKQDDGIISAVSNRAADHSDEMDGGRKQRRRRKLQYRFVVFNILAVAAIAIIIVLIKDTESNKSRLNTLLKGDVAEKELEKETGNSLTQDLDDRDKLIIDEVDVNEVIVDAIDSDGLDKMMLEDEVPSSNSTQRLRKDYARVSLEKQPTWRIHDIASMNVNHENVIEFNIIEHKEQDMMDSHRITHLDRRLLYQLKEANHGMSDEEKREWLKTNPDEFFYEHMTWAFINNGINVETIYERLIDMGVAITYRVYDNTANMLMFQPFDYIVKGEEVTTSERIYLFIMYDIELRNGKVYSRCNMINPLVFWVNSETILNIDDFMENMEKYRFPYIDIKAGLDRYRELMGIGLIEDDLIGQVVSNTIKTNVDYRPPYNDEITKFQRMFSINQVLVKTSNILKDPFQDMTFVEKTNKLSDNPEEFFDKLLLGIDSESSGFTMKEILISANATIHYYVDYKHYYKKAYVYGDIPITTSMLDVEGSLSEEVYLFYLYEISIGADNRIYGVRDLYNPTVCIIQDRRFYENCKPGEYQCQYLLVSDVQDLSNVAIDIYNENILNQYDDEYVDEQQVKEMGISTFNIIY